MSACAACAGATFSNFSIGEACAECGHVPIPAEPPGVYVESAAPSPSFIPREPLALIAPPPFHEAEGVVTMPETLSGPAESEPKLSEPAVSPTGAPVLPSWIPSVASALVAIAVVVQQTAAPHTIAFQLAGVVIGIGAALGIVSQGARKK